MSIIDTIKFLKGAVRSAPTPPSLLSPQRLDLLLQIIEAQAAEDLYVTDLEAFVRDSHAYFKFMSNTLETVIKAETL